ncbi:MAG: hypothetical protein ACD_35C00177G0003 [uncultured bacterium]|nr:MAG: hypothetical protein ACD_35C00177G0003 [uncultured bacterium]
MKRASQVDAAAAIIIANCEPSKYQVEKILMVINPAVVLLAKMLEITTPRILNKKTHITVIANTSLAVSGYLVNLANNKMVSPIDMTHNNKTCASPRFIA